MEDKKEKNIQYCPVTGKRCYSEREANEVLNEIKRGIKKNGKRIRKKSRHKQIPKRKYYCKYCGMYHLTHLTYFYNNKEQTK